MELTKIKFKKTALGLIPVDWNCLRVKDITKFHKQGYYTTEPYSERGKYYLLRGTDMQNPTISLESTPRVNSNDTDYAAYQVQENDFLIVRSGAIGRYGIVPPSFPKSIFGSYLINFRFINQVDTKYFGYFYQSRLTVRQLNGITQGGGNLNINAENIKSLQLPIPQTLAEQKAIATALSDVDEMIHKLEKLIEKKKAIKQGAMQQLLTPPHKGGKRLEGFSGEWVEKRLGDLVEVILGGGTPSRAVKEFWNGNIPWVTVKDFSCFNPNSTEEYISELGLKNSSTRVIETGTIILATRMAIGKASIYNVPVSINQDLKALYFKKGVSAEFMFNWFLKNSNTLEQLGNGSTVMGISVSDLKNLKVQIPKDTIEQHAIAQTLSAMNLEISEIENKSFKIAEIKQGMMQELLTGRTRLI